MLVKNRLIFLIEFPNKNVTQFPIKYNVNIHLFTHTT